ncbi:hypothetical protein B0O80DRAFT_446811 [Mortierella sp. GBAus27b]|nr:hypothetical protein BGX31_004036 [Mortierella sp. GBA43]KAI8357227.1 hypothetical protein B0O80DRAFT_446811 [Mortierella sp. GBAus27b]
MTPPLDEFRAWAKEHGVASRMAPHESKGMGTGLFFNLDQDEHDMDNLQQGELLFVPQSLFLSRSRILQMHCPHLQTAFKIIGQDNITERVAFILFLLYERLALEHRECFKVASSKGVPLETAPCSPSSFAPYVAMLPDVCTPVTLDPGLTRGYLAGTLLLDSVCAKRSQLESEFELLSGNLGVFESWPVRPSLDNFVWADATFWSRALSFGTQWAQSSEDEKPAHIPVDDMHMVPYLDFANHAGKPNIRWHVDKDGLRVWAMEALVDVVDDQDHSRNHGPEVYLSYGNKSNMELLFMYGFTLQNNPMQKLTLAMPMDEDDPYYMPKAHTLMRLGIPPRVTLYLDKDHGPEDLVEFCQGLWITKESQYLLWMYSLNEEDGLGALMEEPDLKVCTPQDSASVDEADADVEEADLVDEDTVGRLMLTIQGTRIVSKDLIHATVPQLEIYPVLVLRSLLLVANRVEFYIARIMETGDKVQRVEDIEIVRAINYDASASDESGTRDPLATSTDIPSASRVRRNIGDCLVPTFLEPDHDHPITSRQLEVEMLVSSLVLVMKSYRTEEMDVLVHVGNLLGEAQTRCLEESDFIQTYLTRMQTRE